MKRHFGAGGTTMPGVPSSLAAAMKEAGLAAERCTLLEGLPERKLLRFNVPGAGGWRTWQHLRAAAATTGFWPVLIGGHYGTDFVFHQLGFSCGEYADDPDFDEPRPMPPSPADILTAAECLSFENWVDERHDPNWWSRHYLEKAEHIERITGEQSSITNLYRQFAAEWRDNPPREKPLEEYAWPNESELLPLQQRPATLEALDDKYQRVFAESVALVLCPVSHSWQAPAHLPFDPVEDSDRPPALHVSFLRWLADRYGAELIGIGDRTLDVLPLRRPTTQHEAMLLARMIHTYAVCPETGDENTKKPQWAAFLMHSPLWSFCFPG
jgi:hypothetical protein